MAAQSPAPDDSRFFDDRVEPILRKRCLGCHNQELKDGGVSFLDYDGLLKGGGRGPTVVPGNPAESILIQAVRQEGELKMPPGAKLSTEDIGTLTAWIERGAPRGAKIPGPVRLPPTDFPDLPKPLIRELEKRGCTIPQSTGVTEPHNVIRGHFAESGQTDWAVLCSKDRASTLIVFWNGSRQNASELARTEDGDGSSPFVRRILPAGAKDMIRNYRTAGGRRPPPSDHQGIEDAAVVAKPVVHFYSRGKWIQLIRAE